MFIPRHSISSGSIFTAFHPIIRARYLSTPEIETTWEAGHREIVHSYNISTKLPNENSRPRCSSGVVSVGSGHLASHIAGLVTILFVSTCFTVLPLLCTKIEKTIRSKLGNGRWWKTLASYAAKFCWASKYFGTGIILGSAFIHIMPAAHIQLGDPCLPPLFTEEYTAFPDAIMLLSMVIIFLIDFASKRYLEKNAFLVIRQSAQQSLRRAPLSPSSPESLAKGPLPGIFGTQRGPKHQHCRSGSFGPHATPEAQLEGLVVEMVSHPSGCSTSPKGAIKWPGRSKPSLSPAKDDPRSPSQPRSGQFSSSFSSGKSIKEALNKQECFNLLVLEAGIVFHSLFIGIALMVVEDSEFYSLFTAIVFHQTFEGLALGARLAALEMNGSCVPLLACLVYGATTPLGCVVGILIRNSFDIYSEKGLIITGVFDALSAGLLLYGGIVGLLAKDFLGDMTRAPAKMVYWSIGLFLAGLLAMAVLGRWA